MANEAFLIKESRVRGEEQATMEEEVWNELFWGRPPVPWTRQHRQIQQVLHARLSIPRKVIFSPPHSLSPCIFFFSLFTATHWATAAKIYELKLELSIVFLTLIPFLRPPPSGSSQVKSGLFRLFRGADGSLPTRLSACPHWQKPGARWEKRSLWKRKHQGLCSQLPCVNIFSEAFPADDEGTHLGPAGTENKRVSNRFNEIARRFYYRVQEMGQHKIKVNVNSKCSLRTCDAFVSKVPARSKHKWKENGKEGGRVVKKQLFHLGFPVGKSGKKKIAFIKRSSTSVYFWACRRNISTTTFFFFCGSSMFSFQSARERILIVTSTTSLTIHKN